jgi:ABC-type branched-subunit amino acid transport system substrate-binding protein
MVKARNTNADVMVFCNYGPDTQNALKAFVTYGLQKRMRVGGINAGDEVARGMPVDDIEGSVWGYDWGPDASERSVPVQRLLTAANGGALPNWRNYLGYIAASQYIDRLNSAGTTGTEALVKAFEDHRFNGGKETDSVWRACDHQNVQETYAARIVSRRKRGASGGFFEISERLDGIAAAGDCDNPDSAKAAAIMRTQVIAPRNSRRLGA